MLIRDFLYAVRVLRKSPTFALTAIATLALCIGANTAIFSAVDAVLFRPLPYPEPGRLAIVATRFQGKQSGDDVSQDGRTWEYLRDHVQTLDLALSSGDWGGVNLVSPANGAVYVQQGRVSSGYFRVLGVAPAIGREISLEEDRKGGPSVVVLSDDLWVRMFHSDRQLVGRSILLRGEPHTVIGIMPRSFQTTPASDLWSPLRGSHEGEGAGDNYLMLARIRPGRSWPQADAELAALGNGLFADRHLPPGQTLRLHLMPVQAGLAEDVQEPLLLVWAAVGLVLLIGCANVAGLLLARGSARQHEIATRMALGSGRGAIVRQLLSESLLIALLGGVGGLACAYAALDFLGQVAAKALGAAQPMVLDGRVLAMSLLTALLTSLIFGLYPAWEATKVDIRSGISSASRTSSSRHTGRRALIVCEVALSMLLLASAGLVLRTLVYLTTMAPGYDGRDVLTASLSLQDARYKTSIAINHLFEESLLKIRETPGVQAAGIGLTLPYERALNDSARVLSGADAMSEDKISNVTYVTPGYFEALRMNRVRGRLFAESDGAAAQPVAIITEAYVRTYMKTAAPVGAHIRVAGADREIVGVVADIQAKNAGWGNIGPVGALAGIYVPASQIKDGYFQLIHTWFTPKWVVRGQGPLGASVRKAVEAVDPQLPFAEFRKMDEVRSSAFTLQRLEAVLLGTLAGLALLLASVGIYGLIAHSVVERRREFGIRMALGASARQMITTAAGPGIGLAILGIAIGVGLALWAGKAINSLLWGVSPHDALTFLVVAGVLGCVAAAASVAPSLRIARMDPAATLRDE